MYQNLVSKFFPRHGFIKQRGIENCNGTLKTIKIKISATPVDREKDFPELGAAGFSDDNLSRDF